MVEEKLEPRDTNYRQMWPWTELFRGFQVAIDPKKLLVAAAGILVMALSWWLLAVIFYASRDKPDWGADKYSKDEAGAGWKDFKEDRRKWNVLYEAAGYVAAGEAPKYIDRYTDANDLAESAKEYDAIKHDINNALKEIPNHEARAGVPRTVTVAGKPYVLTAKPVGRLRIWPWFEDRGPNPYLLVTGQAGVPWQAGHAWEWLLTKQLPVLIEPLVKLLLPVVYLLRPDIGIWNQLYFLLVILATIATWALFGGAITRMAAVQIARKEKIGLGEALRFTLAHYRSYFFASLAPLLGVGAILVLLILFGVVHLIPVVGELWDGLLWPVVLLLGLAMAVILVGLVGWPLIHVTISAEGSDSFDALSRSYSYVYQKPWNYLWYCLVSLMYGAAVVFFVGFMGSLMVYLGKVGVSQTPLSKSVDRDPSYLFVYAPTSFGWSALLLQGSTVEGQTLVDNGVINEAARLRFIDTTFKWRNYVGVFLVSAWIYLVFLMIVGFGYSYFWSASTIIYLLMRRKVDDTEMDEVFLEEEEPEETYSVPTPAAASPPTSPSASPGLTMVDTPALRSSSAITTAPVAPSAAAPAAPAQGDHGNPPAGG